MTDTANKIQEETEKSPVEPLLARAKTVVGPEWEQLAVEPVAGKAPAGANVRLEPLFEQVEAEIAKLESLTNEAPVEWEQMIQWCREILKDQSKDMLVACYLSRALCEGNLLQGMMRGAVLLLSLSQAFWESGFPPKKRTRGRAAAYNWWVEQCAPLVEKFSFNVGHLENLALLLALLESLDAFLLERLGEEAPGLNELLQPLRRHQSALEAEQRARSRQQQMDKPRPAASPTERSNTQSTAGKSTDTGQSIGSDRDLMNCYRSVQDTLRGACDYIRHDNLANPEAYRINRFITWLGVTQLPPATKGITQLRPPSKEKLQHFDALLAAANYRELIPDLETSLSKAPYWITGQRMAHEALNELGYSECAAAVVDGVRTFVERFPDVVNLRFSDQTEFADARTRQWLQLEVLTASGGAPVHSLPVSGDQGNEWEMAYKEAKALYRDKKTAEAFAVFRDGCRQAFSRRSLAFWRFYQARFCFETGQTDLTIALLESVQRDLEERQYDEWEPDISAKVIELLIRAYQQQSDKDIPRKRVAALHERLCQFDLATAYELSIN